jgi:hypothetical protein
MGARASESVSARFQRSAVAGREQIGNLAEDLSGIAAGGSFEHKDFRINEVSSCFVKINIMFSNALL